MPFLLAWLLYTPAVAHTTAELNKMRTFGTGKSEFLITAAETTLFEYNVSATDSYGVFTHFWITGSPAAGAGR